MVVLKLNSQQLQALIISLLVHAVVVLLALLLPKYDIEKPTNQPIEVVYQTETPKKAKQIVMDPSQDMDSAIRDLKDNVTRLSRITRRVLQEQIAAKNGPT